MTQFEDFPVPQLNSTISTASAPSDTNQQAWRFVVVSSPDLMHQIHDSAEKKSAKSAKLFLETPPYLIVVFRIDYGLTTLTLTPIPPVRWLSCHKSTNALSY